MYVFKKKCLLRFVSKLTQFDATIHGEQHISSLDVAMDNMRFVQEVQAFAHVLAHECNLLLAETLLQLCHDAVHGPAITVFDQHPQLLFLLEGLDQLHYVRVFAFWQNVYFHLKTNNNKIEINKGKRIKSPASFKL